MSNLHRSSIHDAHIRFRVANTLLHSAEEKAQREGMTLSELLRHALRRELREVA
ncbi:UNVERIFIED_ORG: putative DNA binding CopG/RHH family protein [Sphingomonas sp. 1057]